jgi:hypothetical protein
MAQFTLGKNCKLYFSATLLTGSNTATVLSSATEVGNIKDLTLNLEKGESDVTTRGDGGWTVLAPTLKTATVDGQVKWLASDAFFTAVQTSYNSDTEYSWFVLDGDKATVGVQGFVANFIVYNFTRNETLTEAVMVDFSAKPSSFPAWYTVSS